MAKTGRRKGMTQEELDPLKRTIASSVQPNRPFVCGKPTASGEEVHRAIVLAATNIYETHEDLIQLAAAPYWNANFAACLTNLDKAKQCWIMYNGKLTEREIENICLVIYKYIR